jgi:DNA-binding NtrC family response regulator
MRLERARGDDMSVMSGSADEILSGSPLKVPEGARILIVCDSGPDTERLKAILAEEGFLTEWARSITAGCEAAKSGKFQVVLSTPLLADGSWRRLSDIASHYGLGYEIVLWARNYDLQDWAMALEEGAFDVLDAMCEQPKAVETTKGALWAAYLKGAGPNLSAANRPKAA